MYSRSPDSGDAASFDGDAPERDPLKDLSQSAQVFCKLVWPRIASWVGGGELQPVEIIGESFARDLDVLAGIDAWHILRDQGLMRGIASRVQAEETCKCEPGKWPYRTFTVRTGRPSGIDTELQKRLRAIREPYRGWLFPPLTVHAYVRTWSNGPLDGVGMTHTADLMLLAERLLHEGWPVFTVDNATMMAIPYSRLEAENIPVGVWPPNRQRGFWDPPPPDFRRALQPT